MQDFVKISRTMPRHFRKNDGLARAGAILLEKRGARLYNFSMTYGEAGTVHRSGRTFNIEYGALQAFYWANYGVSVMFAVTFLLARGLSNSMAGLVMALGNILACCIQPAVASLADRHEKVTLPRILCVFSVIMAASCLVLRLTRGASALVLGAYVLYMAFHLAGQPICSCFCGLFEKRGVFINFGLARGAGSLCYAVLTAFLGVIVARRGADVLPVFGFVIVCCFFAVSAALGRQISGGETGNAAPSEPGRAMLPFLRENKSFCLLLCGIMIIFFSHNVFNCFTLNLVEHLGGDSADLGRVCSFVAFLEMPAMFFFEPLCRRFSARRLMRLSVTAFTAKAFLIALAPSLAGLYAANLLQLVSFAVFVPASVRYVDETVSRADAVKGQSCITSVITFGSVLSSLLGGVMLDGIGVKATFFAVAAVSVLGTAAALCAMRAKARKN